MIKFKWLISRFLRMSFGELIYRLRQQSVYQLDRIFRKKFSLTKQINFKTEVVFHIKEIPDIIFKKKYSIFDNVLNISDEIDWHLDISSNERFPLKYCRSINTRLKGKRSAKHAWEVNRLQFLTNICFAYKNTN